MITCASIVRGLPIALLTVVVVLLSLFVLHRQSDPVLHNSTVNALNKLAATEDELLRDLLAARSGLLHNYDGVNESLVKISDAHRLLAANLTAKDSEPGQEYAALLDRLESEVLSHAKAVHRLVSDVAVFRKSLLYLPECARELQSHFAEANLAISVDRLLLSTRMYVHDSSKKWSDEIDQVLGGLEAQEGSFDGGSAERFVRLRKHAEHIKRYRDRVAQTMTKLAARPLSACSDAILTTYLDHHAMGLADASRYRTTLATLVFALLLGLCAAVLVMNTTARSLSEANERDQRVNDSLASLVSSDHAGRAEEFYNNSARSLANAFSTAIAFISIPRQECEGEVETIALFMDG